MYRRMITRMLNKMKCIQQPIWITWQFSNYQIAAILCHCVFSCKTISLCCTWIEAGKQIGTVKWAPWWSVTMVGSMSGGLAMREWDRQHSGAQCMRGSLCIEDLLPCHEYTNGEVSHCQLTGKLCRVLDEWVGNVTHLVELRALDFIKINQLDEKQEMDFCWGIWKEEMFFLELTWLFWNNILNWLDTKMRRIFVKKSGKIFLCRFDVI